MYLKKYTQYLVLSERRIKATGRSYVGGRQFGNYEGHLPERDAAGNKISYREWGYTAESRGAEPGSTAFSDRQNDGSLYTPDHYNSFTEISSKLKNKNIRYSECTYKKYN